MDEVYSDKSFQEQNRFLSAYKERLFKKLKTIKDGEYISEQKVNEYKKRIASIEEYETFISYFEDLIAICDTRGFGYWAGENFETKVDISSLDFSLKDGSSKKYFLFIDPKKKKIDNTYSCLTNVVNYNVTESVNASLSVCLQIFKDKDNRIYLKVMLVNTSTPVALEDNKYYSIVTEHVNERCFFGVKIEISSPNIIPYNRNENISAIEDIEAKKLRDLYRTIEDFGVGHLCSVNWTHDTNGLYHVFSDFLPEVETPDVEAEPRDKTKSILSDGKFIPAPFLADNVCLRFKWLSVLSGQTDDVSDDIIREGLLRFVDTYHEWIRRQDAQGNGIREDNLQKCIEDYHRMKNNVVEFLSDDEKMLHFRLMNTAMFMQLWHSKNQKQVYEDASKMDISYYCHNANDMSIFKGTHAAWRPFQLAFILLNLDGIYQSSNDPKWDKRNELVDLVWFPTGGGKTEAYLGIIALTIIKRRMCSPEGKGNGVAAIMRYTLRLLTTQQFQRALRLILALEQIRRWEDPRYDLGDEEISIGLYVGDNSLPNHYDDFAKEVRDHWNDKGSHGKIPLDVCPWCGSQLRAKEISADRYRFHCSNKYCTYGKRKFLPVRLCDDHILESPPSLLFGTVDKFAQIARRIDTSRAFADSRQIFGNNQVLPPELIIQDELHLLLGPLGSAVALFEGAIDQLCSYKNRDGHTIRPKIISSTATTRNTSFQVRALYDRDVSIFPKNGTDYDDSFFAFFKRQKSNINDDWSFVSKRKYIGIMPTGRTQMTTQMRLAAIIFVHRAIFEQEHLDELINGNAAFIKAADYYYSTISYFNSLREVGKTDAQFFLEFTKYTRRLFKRILRFNNMLECFYAYNEIFTKSELTGRLTGGEAVLELNLAQTRKWDPIKRLPFKLPRDEKYRYPELPTDYILATNMISVGLDVSRFNLMIINSMPRNIAEYIQASSRVARDECGLVLTLHNPFRSRDVSHFEKYKEFHEKLYYYVDPISITPFSPKAIEKYLPLYLAAIIRHKYNELADRNSASKMTDSLAQLLKNELKKYFISRFERTKNLPKEQHLERGILTEGQLQEIIKWIDESLDQWVEQAAMHDNLVYYAAGRRANSEQSLLLSPDDYADKKKNSKWVVPTSLRMVEPESVLHILKD